MHKLQIPLSDMDIRNLHIGDEVSLSGTIITGRDAAHTWLLKSPRPEVTGFLKNSLIYHCGPVVNKSASGWSFVAAGPTTSIREEPYEADVIRRYGVRAVIGKGGMGARTLAALKDFGAVYLNGIGGAAQYYARTVEEVLGVHLLEFGIPEAMWHLRVKDFAAIVTMDAHGNSLHADVERQTGAALEALRKA